MLGDAHWYGQFDVIITSADKPHWYTSNRPFRRLEPATGRVEWSEVTRISGGGLGNVLVHGNLKTFVELTGWKQVLYAGDHVES